MCFFKVQCIASSPVGIAYVHIILLIYTYKCGHLHIHVYCQLAHIIGIFQSTGFFYYISVLQNWRITGEEQVQTQE